MQVGHRKSVFRPFHPWLNLGCSRHAGGRFMPTRRDVLKASAGMGMAIALPSGPFFVRAEGPDGIEINDVQSQLNATRVHEIRKPRSIGDLQATLMDARRQARAVCTAGGRHAM